MENDLKLFWEKIIKKLNVENQVIIAIDGLGGSGKSTISERLAQFDKRIEIVKMDDFYLPSSQRLKLEFSEITDGQNYDIKRLINQVIMPYKNKKEVNYQKYDWIDDKLGEFYKINNGKILIIEGVYSFHESIREHCNIKILVECNRNLRLQRGLERDGFDAYDNWVGEWMPLEDKYVDRQHPKEKSDYIVYTDLNENKYKFSNNNGDLFERDNCGNK